MVRMHYTSYAGSTGIWQYWEQQDPHPQTKMNGLFCQGGAVRIAEIIDGTSNTLLLGERCTPCSMTIPGHGGIGGPRETTATPCSDTLWPMNPFRRTSDSIRRYRTTPAPRRIVSGTSSLHPGGL